MKLPILALAGAQLCGSAAAAPPVSSSRNHPPAIAASVARVNVYPLQEVQFPQGVRGIPGVPFWQGDGFRPLTLDLYLPPSDRPKPGAGFPLVIYIHGGGWLGGDPQRTGAFVNFPGVLASLAERGYVVASVEYRLSGEARFPAQIQDVKAAIRWLRAHADRYRIDPARAMAWGASAGGHLAALPALSYGAKPLEPRVENSGGLPNVESLPEPASPGSLSDCVRGAVAWYGVFDFTSLTASWKDRQFTAGSDPRAPMWALLGCREQECRPEDLAAASPARYVDARDPPMLPIVGSNDATVPPAQTLEMADRLKIGGVPHEVLVLPNVDHSFIGKTLEATQSANRRALAATFDFIDQTLGKTPPGEGTGIPSARP